MLIRFDRHFALPIDEIFGYFRTPADWTRLYGLADEVQDRGDGWVAVPLESFPFPLVAKNTDVEHNRRVRWKFRGFWRGDGEVRFVPADDGVRIEGYERIAVRWLGFLSPLVEKLFLERRFRAIWDLGWRRLEKRAQVSGRSGPGTADRGQGPQSIRMAEQELKCPRTGASLSSLSIGGVEVDVCEDCGGLWLDRFEIAKFDRPELGLGEALAVHLEQFPPPLIDHTVRIRCPRHSSTVMLRRRYSPALPIEIDECPQCGGVWLDADELAVIRSSR